MFSPQNLENSAGSSQLNLDYRQDLEKLTSLCKDLNPSSTQGKKKLQASHREYLQDEITSLEKKLKETNTMNRNLKEQLSLKEHELDPLKTNYSESRQSNLLGFHSTLNNDLREKYLSNAEHTKEILDRNKDQYLNFRSEIDYKGKEISDLHRDLQERTAKMSSALVSNDKNLERVFLLEKQLLDKQERITELSNLVEKMKKENVELTFSKKSEGVSLIETEHLRNDVRRLLQMLRSTKEFKDFAEYADDTGKSITFLKEIPVKSVVDCKCACMKCKHARPCLVEESKYIDEKLLWAPSEAFNFIHQYRLQYKGELSDALIENLFFELNKIWGKREEKAIDRVKASLSHEMASLRRQLELNNKYDDVVKNQEIIRLKGQLKRAYKENRENFDNRAKRNPPGVELIKETMKIKQETEKFKKRFTEENAILKEAISNMESNRFKDNSEKAVFMEGVTWAAKKMQKDCEECLEEVFSVLKRYSLGDDTIADRSQMIKCVETALGNIRDRVNFLKENSEKEMINSKAHVRRSMSNKLVQKKP